MYGRRKRYSRRKRSRNYKRFPRKRRYKKRFSSSKRDSKFQTVGVRSLPYSQFFRFKYTDTKNYSVASSYYYTFSTNSLYDPDVTGVGNQPISFDQWSAIYATYRVFSSKIILKVCNNSGNPLEILLGPTLHGSSWGSFDGMKSTNNFKNRFLSPLTGSGSKTTMVHYVKNKSLFRCKDLRDNEDYAAPVGSNPSVTGKWMIGFLDSKGGTLDITFSVDIYYYAEMYNLQQLDMS